MRGSYERQLAETAAIERNILQGTATLCSPIFGRVCKTIWPRKTAEELASVTGHSVRTAAYQISGEHEPSARAIAAVLNALLPRAG